ncbi:MAG TPA: hypothetical protein VL500_05650 [Candidatus Eisenbacteria bacterium]|nr:hypothetical protein [Candidatus Eisenbacteria bacterium]
MRAITKIVSIAASLLLIGAGCPDLFGQARPPGPPPGAAGNGLTAGQKRACGITAQVTEGPYYVSGAELLKDGNLNYAGLPGSPLKITGHVYEGLDDTKPLKDAIVNVWQADNAGNYHPNGNGQITKYETKQIALRGHVVTDENGAYEFTTIYPGEYAGRTRHIHVKVLAPGYTELTTQLIVPSLSGDKIGFDDDSVSQGLPNCHLLTIDTSKTPATASFDFRLPK